MAYTTMKTWTSEVLTSSDMNTYLRDNIEYLKGVTDGVTFSGVQADRLSNQAISTSSATNVSFSSEGFDYGGWFGGSGTAITVPSAAVPAGYTSIAVAIFARGRFASNGTGYRRLRVLINGSAAASISVDANAGAETEVNVTDYAVVESGDTIALEAYQTSGGSLNLETCTLHVIRQAPVA